MQLAEGLDHAALGNEMYALADRLFPIPRSLTGPGFRETLAILEERAGPIERHRFASGQEVFDWTIPNEWTLRDAWLEGPGGERVVSLDESSLHVVGYSAPVHRTLTLDELQPHLHSLPDQPEAVPYRTSYYAENWGFCLSDRRRRELRPGRYEAFIDADLEPGALEIGELVVQGTGASEVMLSTYCCHPSMANNELSGPVVAARLAELLAERPERPRHTYRFLFLPETIGAIAYLSRFGARMLERLVAGYVVTCVGDRGQFTYKRSRRGDTLADRVALHVLASNDFPHRIVDFFPMGSDERQYCSPGFDLPVGSLMRTPYFHYPEYHTSLDDMSFISPRTLGESLLLYAQVVDALEATETFSVTQPFCEPQLGKRGLYPATGGSLDTQRLHDMLHLLNFCDGTADLLAVAERIGRPVWELRAQVDSLCDHDLMRRIDEAPAPGAGRDGSLTAAIGGPS